MNNFKKNTRHQRILAGRRPLALAIAATLLLGSSLPDDAAAAVSTWTGGASQDWRTASNWTQPPTIDSSVLIDAVIPNPAHISGSTEELFYLTVGGAGHGTLRVDGGGRLHVSAGMLGDGPFAPTKGMVIGDSAGSVGDVTVSGAGSVLTVENHTHVGYDGTGTLSVLNGGTANLGLNNAGIETLVGFGFYAFGANADRTGSGTINVDGAGSTLNYAGGMNVLNGALNVTGGGQLNSVYRAVDGAPFWIDTLGLGLPASDAGFPGLSGAGVATVSGVGSAWNSLNGLSIGQGGEGSLRVLDGGSASFLASLNVGDAGVLLNPDGSRAGLYLAGAGTLLVSGQGSTLALAAASSADPGTLTVGAGGAGAVSVSEGGEVSVAGLLNVGQKTDGALDIASGGTLTVGGRDGNGMGAVLGRDVGVQGKLTVTGGGSTLTVDAGMQVGNAGIGAFSVLDGAIARVGLSTANSELLVGMGHFGFPEGVANGTGTVTVDGAGSTLNYAGGFNLNDGSLAITHGGQLLSQRRDVDTTPVWLDIVGFGSPAYPDWDHPQLSGTGDVTVSGAGSQWISVNGLAVGLGGTGTLSILEGGKASFVDRIDLGANGYLTDLNGQVVGTQAGTASVRVSGAGSRLSVAAAATGTGLGRLRVGDVGAASLLVEQQAEVSVAGTLLVGGKSQGQVTIASGAVLAVDGSDSSGIGMTLGRDAGARGDMTVTGSGSTLTVDAGAQIGGAGTGSLSVLGGATASIGLQTPFSEITLGVDGAYSAPAPAYTVNVDGAGSALRYAGGLNVLNGTVMVDHGGQLVTELRDGDGPVAGGSIWSDLIGYRSVQSASPWAGGASVYIQGDGSAWTSQNSLLMGHNNSGLLSVLDGGTATFAGVVNLGVDTSLTDGVSSPAPGMATLIVGGQNSRLSIVPVADPGAYGTGKLIVGSTGYAKVNVYNGGQLLAPGGVDLGSRGELLIGSPGPNDLPGDIHTPVVNFMAPTATLRFDHASTDYAFDARLAGAGLVDVIGGFTRLTADSHAFSGATHIGDTATLSVDGSLGGTITVDEFGRLQGTGTIGSADVSGTLAPGNSPGTLHLTGDLVMRSTSVYEAQIDTASGVSDSVVVAGNVTIQPGSTLKVENIGGGVLKPGDSLNLVQATGSVAGEFALVDDPTSPFLGYGVTYSNGGIMVDVARSSLSFASIGTTPAETAAGRALDSLPEDSALTSLVYGQLDSEAKAAAAIRQMPGYFAADTRRVMLNDSRLTRDTVLARLQRASDSSEASAAWVQGTGAWSSTDASATTAGAKSHATGMMLGADVGLDDVTRFGVAAGFGQTSYRMAGQNASAHIKSSHLAVYARSGMGAMALSYGAAYSWNKIGSNRSFDVGSARQQLNGDHHARTGQVFADLGYRLGSNASRYLEPFVSAAYAKLGDDGWKETGAPTALATGGANESATFATLGLRWSAATAAARVFGTLGWRRVLGSDHVVATQSFVAGGDAFEVQSLPMLGNAAVVELGMDFALGKHAHLSTSYTGLLGSGSRDNGGRVLVTFDF